MAHTGRTQPPQLMRMVRRVGLVVVVFGVVLPGFDAAFRTTAEIEVRLFPASPSSFPFIIANPSRLFVMRNIVWTCRLLAPPRGSAGTTTDPVMARGTATSIRVLGDQEFSCPIAAGADAPQSPELSVDIEYDTDLLSIYRWHRHPKPAAFRWLAAVGNSRWVERGMAE